MTGVMDDKAQLARKARVLAALAASRAKAPTLAEPAPEEPELIEEEIPLEALEEPLEDVTPVGDPRKLRAQDIVTRMRRARSFKKAVR